MRRIYLIRHAHPDFPLGERRCVGGRTDLPLGVLGRMQASLLPTLPELRDLGAVFCSSLSRARQTALPLCPSPRVMPGLEEQDMGVWDGLSFREIRERFPELYEAREADPSLLPEGAESMDAVRARMHRALLRCLRESEGDIALVSHRTALASLIGRRELLLHGSVTVLRANEEAFEVESVGLRPCPPLTRELGEKLLSAAAPGERIEAHCRAVAAEAQRIARALPLELNEELLVSAALLHDVARSEKDHARLGAAWLRELGYPDAAAIAERHHDWSGGTIDEAAVLFLADKCVREDRRVTLEERFAASEAKCRTPEAKAAHDARRETALRLRDEINRLCARRLVE
ncbi:MAG: histidine phosphatase family protein [Oscillospiraceae bacterium]|nr:histidine phosphatase family protein [Oscillospiraceae bacterium]